MICQHMEKQKVWEYAQEVTSITQNIGFKDNHDKIQVHRLQGSSWQNSGTKVKYSVIVLGWRNGDAGISKTDWESMLVKILLVSLL